MITLTDRAVEHVKHIRLESGDATQALRIAVAAGGCSGFTYELYLDGEVKDGDQVIEFGDLRVVVDPMSMSYLAGTEVDYVRKSSYEAAFQFNNPNVTSECGCGKSFNTN